MKIGAKTKTPEPARYVPDGLCRPFPDEVRNRARVDPRNPWTPETYTAWMRRDAGSEYQFCLNRLNHQRHWRLECLQAFNQFKASAYPKDSAYHSKLARLESALEAASAEYEYAEGLLHVEQERAA
jgi:hypothetical protein